ncbi:major capsid protein [Microvirus sp.]|nr:major capsid protein [Microvirus sp.]
MGIFNTVDSGTKLYRSHFNLSHRKFFDADFTSLYPSLCKLMLPGDIFKIGGRAIVRYQPTVAPIMNSCILRTRYFVVPLRQIYEDTELIITGSKNGYFDKDLILPKFPSCFEGIDKSSLEVEVGSFLDYIGCQTGEYYKSDEECLPANYFFKAFMKIFYDYYIDENIQNHTGSNESFDTWFKNVNVTFENGTKGTLPHYKLKKDYFTSCLPFILKGEVPVLETNGIATFTPSNPFVPILNTQFSPQNPNILFPLEKHKALGINTAGSPSLQQWVSDMNDRQTSPQTVNVTGLGFTMEQLRALAQETRIFERLARCGSRYTEYLQSNFGISPADESLQRALYLGGWKMPIVTTEVLQTAQDGNSPVGTMRGHGIASGGEYVTSYTAKEFCVLFGITTIEPQIIYTQGIPREYTYKERFDFFNPSFQNLSEQAVRNSEIFYSNDNKNLDTFGYQGYFSELRSDVDKAVGNFRTSQLNYWTQSVKFNSRPNLNFAFINANSYTTDFNRPFNVIENTKPVLIDYYNDIQTYRPLVKYPVPGLLDHN